jgi:hypothetical protein
MKRNLFRGLLLPVIAALGFLAAPAANAASLIYDSFFGDIYGANIAVNSDTFKCMLVTSSYTPNKGTHDRRNDVTNEVSGTGYTSGGTTCTVAGSLDTTNHRYDVSITGPSFATATITARAMVVYKSRGGASSADELVAYIDFGSDVSSTAATFAITVTSPLRIQN